MDIINVIVISSGLLASIDSFMVEPETSAGLDDAQDLFVEKIAEHGCHVDETDAALKAGYYSDHNKHDVYLRWSNIVNLQA